MLKLYEDFDCREFCVGIRIDVRDLNLQDLSRNDCLIDRIFILRKYIMDLNNSPNFTSDFISGKNMFYPQVATDAVRLC